MNMNSLLWKYRFAVLRSPEGGDGGGAGEGGTGSDAGAGAGEVVAGETPAPAAASAPAPVEPENKTFLGAAAEALNAPKLDAEGNPIPPTEGEGEAKPGEAAPTFDLAAVKLAEGFELDAEVGKSFSEILTKEDLSPQERGQQLMDLHTTAIKSAVESAVQQHTEASLATFKTMNDAWREEIKELPEFKADPDAEGGKVIQALISVGADQKFFDALNLTGAGNHPAILQVLHRLTKPLMEGGAVLGVGPQGAKREPGANIYTSTGQK